MSRVPVIAFPEDNTLPPLRIPTHPVIRYIKVLSRTTLLSTLLIYLFAKFILTPTFLTILKGRFEFHNAVYIRLKVLHSKLKKCVKNPPIVDVLYNGKKLIDRTIATDDIFIEETKQYEENKFKKNNNGLVYSMSFNNLDNNNKEVKFSDDNSIENIQGPIFDELNNEINYTSKKLGDRIIELKQKLNNLKVPEYTQLSTSGFNNGDIEMNSLLYQIKQLKTYLEVVTSEPPREMLFKKPLYHIQVGKTDNSNNNGNNYKYNYLDILNDNINEMKRIIDLKK